LRKIECAEVISQQQYLHISSAGILSKTQKPRVYLVDFDKLALFNGLHRASIF